MLSLHNGLVYFHSICVWWMEPRFTQELEAKDIERLAGNEVNVQLYQVGSTPVLKIEFGPPHVDFGSVWSPQKERKYFVTVSI